MNLGIQLPLLGIYALVSLVVAAKSPNPATLGNLVAVGGVGGSLATATVGKNREGKLVANIRAQLERELEIERSTLSDRERDLYDRQRELDREREEIDRERVQLETDRAQWLANREEKWTQSELELDREHADRMRQLDQRETALLNERERFETEREKLQHDRELTERAFEMQVEDLYRQTEAIRLENEATARQWAVEAIEPKNEEIAALQSEIAALQRELSVATAPKLPGGRDRLAVELQRVIPQIWQLGFYLDYENHEMTSHDDLVWLRSRNYFDIGELTKKAGLIQSYFESPHTVTFEWQEKGLILMKLKTPVAVKKVRTKPQDRVRFDEKWIEELFSKAYHFRINGQTGGGKSHFTNNLLTVAMRVFNRPKITIGDPNHPLSSWVIDGQSHTADYQSYEESVEMLAEMKEEIDRRIEKAKDEFTGDYRTYESPNFTPSIWVIDEIDTLVSWYKKEIQPCLKAGLKTGRKYKLLVVIVGQSPLPDDIGLRHPDVNQCAAIHIGVNVPKAIEASILIDKNRKEEMLEEIRWLNDSGKVHYAFVECPGLTPFIALLPETLSGSNPEPGSHPSHLSAPSAPPLPPNSSGSDAPSTPLQDKDCDDLSAPSAPSGTLAPMCKKTGFLGVMGADAGTEPAPITPLVFDEEVERKRVISLLKKNFAIYKIVKEVWGVSKGGSQRYKEKSQLVKDLKSKMEV